MEIDFHNKHIIDEIRIHDSEFTGYVFDYNKRNVTFSCQNIFTRKRLLFEFQNVIIIHSQSCNFWNGGSSIMWMDLIDENEYYHQMISLQSQNAIRFRGSQLDKHIPYISVQFTINSGDTLLITCERIICNSESI